MIQISNLINLMLQLVCESSGAHKMLEKKLKYETTSSKKHGCMIKSRKMINIAKGDSQIFHEWHETHLYSLIHSVSRFKWWVSSFTCYFSPSIRPQSHNCWIHDFNSPSMISWNQPWPIKLVSLIDDFIADNESELWRWRKP